MHWITSFQPKLMIAVILVACVFFEWKKGYFKNFFVNLKIYRWTYVSVLLAVFSVITVAILFLADAKFYDYVQAKATIPWVAAIATAGGKMGRNINPWSFFAIWYVLTVLAKKPSWRCVAFGTFFSSFMTVALCHFVKFAFLRARPYGELGPFSFFNLKGIFHDPRLFQSFPSGDVAIVAGAVAFLIYILKKYPWRWALLVLPCMTALSRMVLHKHWPSDTFFAIGFSLAVAHILFMHQKLNSDLAAGQVSAKSS